MESRAIWALGKSLGAHWVGGKACRRAP